MFCLLQATFNALKKEVDKPLSRTEVKFPVTFTQQSEDGEPCVELDVASEGEIRKGWKITPLMLPVVSKILCSVHAHFYYYTVYIIDLLRIGEPVSSV